MTQAIDMPASRSISMSAHAHANRILHPPSYILPTSSPHHTTKQGQDASSDSTKTNEEGTALVGSLGDLLGSLLVDLAHLRRQANGHVRAQMQSRVQGPAEPPSASTNGNPSGGSAPSTATNTNAGDANGKPPVGGVGAGLMGMGLGAVLPDVQGILGGRLGRGGGSGDRKDRATSAAGAEMAGKAQAAKEDEAPNPSAPNLLDVAAAAPNPPAALPTVPQFQSLI